MRVRIKNQMLVIPVDPPMFYAGGMYRTLEPEIIEYESVHQFKIIERR